MPAPYEYEYIVTMNPKQEAEIRSYWQRYGITDLRQIVQVMKASVKTYYDVIRANCTGVPIDWARE